MRSKYTVLLVLVALVVFLPLEAQYGSGFLPLKCSMPPPFACTDYIVSSEGKNLTVTILNSDYRNLTMHEILFTCDGESFVNPDNLGIPLQLNQGDSISATFLEESLPNGCNALKTGDRFRGDFLLTYSTVGENVNHTELGAIQVIIEGPPPTLIDQILRNSGVIAIMCMIAAIILIFYGCIAKLLTDYILKKFHNYQTYIAWTSSGILIIFLILITNWDHAEQIFDFLSRISRYLAGILTLLFVPFIPGYVLTLGALSLIPGLRHYKSKSKKKGMKQILIPAVLGGLIAVFIILFLVYQFILLATYQHY